MRDLDPFPTLAEPLWPRFHLAMGLGHLAGAYAFIVATMLTGALSDFWAMGAAAVTPASWSRFGEGVLAFPAVTLLLGLWAALVMVPLTLLTMPIAWAAARWLRTGAPVTIALGALTGLLPAAIVFHDAPRLDLFPYSSAAAAGAAFASVIWALCIRPRTAEA